MLLSPTRSLQVNWNVVPGNNGFVVLLDSTKGLMNAMSALTASPAPGDRRNLWAHAVVSYSIKTTTQNVTVDEQILTGNAGTSADWETMGAAGQYTVTAATTTVREFKPLTNDWRILVTAGATGPATLVAHLSVGWGGSDYGS